MFGNKLHVPFPKYRFLNEVTLALLAREPRLGPAGCRGSLARKQIKLSFFLRMVAPVWRGAHLDERSARREVAKQSGQPVISALCNFNSMQPASAITRCFFSFLLLIYSLTLIAAFASSKCQVRSLALIRCSLAANSVKREENVPLCSPALTLSF